MMNPHGALLYGYLPTPVCALCEAPPKLRSGFCVAVAPYKGLTPLAPLMRLSPFPTGSFRELLAILPLLVKLNIVFHTRPFAGFSGKRSFFSKRRLWRRIDKKNPRLKVGRGTGSE